MKTLHLILSIIRAAASLTSRLRFVVVKKRKKSYRYEEEDEK